MTLMHDTYGALLAIYSPDSEYFMQSYFPYVEDPFLFPCAQPKFLQWALSEFSAHETTLFLDFNLPVDLHELRRVFHINKFFQSKLHFLKIPNYMCAKIVLQNKSMLID